MKFGLPEYNPQGKVISSSFFFIFKEKKEIEMSRGRTVLIFVASDISTAFLS